MNTNEYERATIMGTYQMYNASGNSGDYRGVQVNASGQIILASGVYIQSGVYLASGCIGTVTISSGVYVASGIYIASGIGVYIQSGASVILASGNIVVTTVLSGSVAAIPFTYEITRGRVPGSTPWSKIGYNGDVDTADGQKDVIVQPGNYVFPSSGIQMMIKSTVASDRGEAPIGSGAWAVTLYYLDSGYIPQSETITLRGTSGNNTVATDILRVNSMRVTSVGGNAKPYGNLSLTDLSGTLIYGYISSGYAHQRQCVYTVPASNDLYITSIGHGVTGTATGKDAIFTTYANWDDRAMVRVSGFMMPFFEINAMDGYVVKILDPPTKIGQTVDLKVTVTVGNNDSKVTTALRGWLE